MNMKKTLTMVAAAAAMVLTSSAALIRVGQSPRADYTQINDALANAKDGDCIEVEPGVYEPVVVPSSLESIEIVAQKWRDEGGEVQSETVIDAKDKGRCFTARKLETRAQLEMGQVLLRGFQLRNGSVDYAADATEDDYAGGGAFGGVLEGCQVTQCRGVLGGGVAFSVVRSCCISQCTAAKVNAKDPITGDALRSGLGGGTYCCLVTGSRIEYCLGEEDAGGVYAYGGFRPDKRDANLYVPYTSIVVGNGVGKDIGDRCNVSDGNLASRGITRLSEDKEIFALDTGYEFADFTREVDARGWGMQVKASPTTNFNVYFGEYDYLRNPRLAGAAMDIGPIEYVNNDYSIAENNYLLGAQASDFSIDILPTIDEADGTNVQLELVTKDDANWFRVEKGANPSVFKGYVLRNDTGADRELTMELRYTVDGVAKISRKPVIVRQIGEMPSSSKGYAVCFGTGIFEPGEDGEPWQSNEEGMAKDAEDFADAFVNTGLCETDNVFTLTREGATRAAFENALARISRMIASNETVYVTVSTHAGSKWDDSLAYWLCCYDNNGEIGDTDFYQWFAPITAKGGRVIVILDTCHASAAYRNANDPEDVQTRERASYNDSNMFPADGPVAFITAVDFYQASDGDSNGAGGSFTQAFVGKWMELAKACTPYEIPSFLNVFYAVLAIPGGDGQPWQRVLREPRVFNDGLLAKSAVAAPGFYPSLYTVDGESKSAVFGSVYAASLNYKDEGEFGYVEFTLPKLSNANRSSGTIKVKAVFIDPETGRKRTISDVALIAADGSVVFGDVVFSGDRVTGMFDDAVVDGSRVLKSKEPGYAGIGDFAGTWNAVVADRTDGRKVAVSLKVAKNGKVAVKAYDSAGRSYSTTSRLVTGDNSWAVIPVMLTKRGASPVSFQYWIDRKTDDVSVYSYTMDASTVGFSSLNQQTVARRAAKLVVTDGSEAAQEVSFTKPVLKLNSSTGLVTGSIKVGKATYKLYGAVGKDGGIAGFCYRKGAEPLNFTSR